MLREYGVKNEIPLAFNLEVLNSYAEFSTTKKKTKKKKKSSHWYHN